MITCPMGKPEENAFVDSKIIVPETPRLYNKEEVIGLLFDIDRELNPNNYGDIGVEVNSNVVLDKAHELGFGEEFETYRKANGFIPSDVLPAEDNVDQGE